MINHGIFWINFRKNILCCHDYRLLTCMQAQPHLWRKRMCRHSNKMHYQLPDTVVQHASNCWEVESNILIDKKKEAHCHQLVLKIDMIAVWKMIQTKASKTNSNRSFGNRKKSEIIHFPLNSWTNHSTTQVKKSKREVTNATRHKSFSLEQWKISKQK